MINGAIMGFMVGGLFGLIAGVMAAFQTRRLIVIPASAIMGGISFGFMLGCGGIIRNDTLLNQ